MSGWSRFLALHSLLGPSLCYLVFVPTTEVVVHRQVRCCSGKSLVPRLYHDQAWEIGYSGGELDLLLGDAWEDGGKGNHRVLIV